MGYAGADRDTPMKRDFANPSTAAGRCLCGAVRFEIDYPAFWAWHDHTRASRIAHGAAYATYVLLALMWLIPDRRIEKTINKL